MKKSLMSLVTEAEGLILYLMENEGEINEVTSLAIQENDLLLKQKIDGYKVVFDQVAQKKTYLKSVIDEIKTAITQLDNAETRLKKYVMFAMERMGTDELSGEAFRLKLIQSKPSVIIENADIIPADYVTEKIEYKINKNAIYTALKSGTDIAGARLEKGQSLRASVNKDLK